MPAPPKSPVFKSAIAIIAQTQIVANGDLDRQGSPLNLTVPADKTTVPDAISDNIDTTSIVADEPLRINIVGPASAYTDTPLSGSLEQIPRGTDLDDLLKKLLVCPPEASSDIKGNNTEPAVNLLQNESTKEPISMKDCMVKLDILSNNTIKHWTRYNLNSGGKPVYNLRDRHHNEKRQSNRPHRNAKQHVSYAIDYSLTLSEDDEYSVHPGRWVKSRVKNVHVPLSGPSADRMAAQRMIDTVRENTAAKALLELNRNNSINVQRSVTSNNISSSSDQGASSSSDSTQIVSSPEDHDEAHSSPAHHLPHLTQAQTQMKSTTTLMLMMISRYLN